MTMKDIVTERAATGKVAETYRQADACLLAASLDLLEALKAQGGRIREGDGESICYCDVRIGNPMTKTHSKACMAARAAIAKAEGTK